ncbi:MAG TPA: S8 family peptidase [Bacteroidia bacterium]|jgi:subtilisin family serine protease|nr:S8 family peptidase [Bacteroidia bacterium]
MKNFLFFLSLSVVSIAVAQNKKPDNWQTLDPAADNIMGTGAEEAYKTLAGKKAKTIIVAVIDSGTDPEHEDLKDIIWTNPGEIPGNNIDDDHNGYVDDVHGWNFLGGANGDIADEASELARIYQRLSKKFANVDTNHVPVELQKDFAEFKKVSVKFRAEQTEKQQDFYYMQVINSFIQKVKKDHGSFDKESLSKFTPENALESQLKKGLKIAFTLGMKPSDLEKEITDGYESMKKSIALNTMNADSIRQAIVGDDLNNPNERYYGNNHVQGPEALHGTHVAGIIAAIRNNSKGINGIASNVKIMIVRAVPNGDERDKDIANAIRYAVDNGASVINMSFGKYYSPEKSVVDEAATYAQSKNVLIIHAAGNESKNKDVEENYPSRKTMSGEVLTNWIEVGANGYKKGKKVVATFSNYGKINVDLFAPGVDIYSTVPDNKYLIESGTSMAAPCATGVAALLLQYFPELTPDQLRNVLIKTVVPYSHKVNVPGRTKKRIIKKLGTKPVRKKFSSLSVSGGFINANRAAKELLKSK